MDEADHYRGRKCRNSRRRARVGATDMVNAAPTTLDDVTLDELRGALSKALERF
jgi:hypothetical protein